MPMSTPPSPGKSSRNYQLLELEDSATFAEVEVAYRRLLRRYESGCLPSYGLLRVKERHKLLVALKEAYEQIKHAETGGTMPPPPSGGGTFVPVTDSFNPTSAAERSEASAALATVNVGASRHEQKSQLQMTKELF